MNQRPPRRDAPLRHARGARSRQLRIISGQWRGRRWQFPLPDIRPTPDRVRETLFNWLQDRLGGRRVLDLFAGSGALGLEALSRGAHSAIFVEQQPVAASALRALLVDWGAGEAEVKCMSAERFLQHSPTAFDLVFLDPPYAAGLLAPVAARLNEGWLAPRALIYVEHSRRESMPELPAGWRALKTGQAGEVGYHLFEAPSGKEPS